MISARTIAVFPGQGSYDQRLAAALWRGTSAGRATFSATDQASERCYGRPLTEVLFPAEGITTSDLAALTPWAVQLGMFSTAVSLYRWLAEQGLEPDVFLGHSFGEITALCCAGALELHEALQAVCARVDSLSRHVPQPGAMTALAVEPTRGLALVGAVADPQLSVAVINHDRQVVVSGPVEAVEAVERICGIIKVTAERVAAPYAFHSPVVAPAHDSFASQIAELRLRRGAERVYSPISQAFYTEGGSAGVELAAHLVRPLDFPAAVRCLNDTGGQVFLEYAGKPLISSALRRTLSDRDAKVTCVGATAAAAVEPLEAITRSLRDSGLLPPSGLPTELLTMLPGLDAVQGDHFWSLYRSEITGHIGRLARDFLRESASDGAAPTVAPVSASASTRPTADPLQSPATAQAPSASAASIALGRGQVSTELRRLYAEALEYPEDVFGDEVLLEAELGVDSVKQTEMLARVAEHFGLDATAALRVANYDTLGKVVDLVLSQFTGTARVREGAGR